MLKILQNLTPGTRMLLDILWRDGPQSRARVAEITGFSRASVTNIADELIDRGLLVEQAAEKGKRGQPARPLALRGSACYAIGISFSTSYGEVGVIDFAGKLIGQSRFSIIAPTVEAVGDGAVAAINNLSERYRLAASRRIGVGIAIPADFDTKGIALPHTLFPDLAGPGLADRFSQRLGMAAIVENDGRSSAIGERLIGVGTDYRTFMLVHLGHGVGGGLIIHGAPYRGAWGNAGILGQYYPYGSPRPSALDLLETLRAQGFDARDFDWLENAPADSAPAIDAWARRVGEQLSGDLARVSRFFGPEAVLLAGRLPAELLTLIASYINFEAVLRPMDNLPIPPLRTSKLGPAAGVVGAAAVPILSVLVPSEVRTSKLGPAAGVIGAAAMPILKVLVPPEG